MPPLILDSVEIRDFRAFEHLRIERLGRINLIVGKNNVGKTSLLEALWLYARRGSPAVIRQLLQSRDEGGQSSPRGTADAETQILAMKYLFHMHKDPTDETRSIQIGPVDTRDKTLSVNVEWFVLDVDEDGHQQLRAVQPSIFDDETLEQFDLVHVPTPRLVVRWGRRILRYPLDAQVMRASVLDQGDISCTFIPASGLPKQLVSTLWDKTVTTLLEDQVLEALRLIAPQVERVSLVSDSENSRTRVPVVRISDFDERMPLRNMGDGMSRLFGIILALVNAKDGLLLIDEFENGLHYSVQEAVWRLIFEVAQRLNVQVFATTHSWDCIRAFQEVAIEDKETEGLLLRLGRKQGDIVTTIFDEEDLAIATRESIEVR